MIRRLAVGGMVKGLWPAAAGKPSPNGALGRRRQTRNHVTDARPGRRWGNTHWTTEPTSVEKLGDEPGGGVKV